MMENKPHLTSLSLLLIAGLTLSVQGSIRRKNRDKKTSMLLEILSGSAQPTRETLAGEKAFDIHFVPRLLRSVNGTLLLLSPEAAKSYARQVHGVWSFWGDDEQQLYGIFRKLKDKAQISQLAASYQELFGVNLIDKLSSRLNQKELSTLLSIVNKLPNYRTR